MFEDRKIISIIPVQNMKVDLLHFKRGIDEKGNDIKIAAFSETKDVICLALLENKDKRFEDDTGVYPMIFEEYIDFAESELTTVENLYYAADNQAD